MKREREGSVKGRIMVKERNKYRDRERRRMGNSSVPRLWYN